jgi:hypothetical protein
MSVFPERAVAQSPAGDARPNGRAVVISQSRSCRAVLTGVRVRIPGGSAARIVDSRTMMVAAARPGGKISGPDCAHSRARAPRGRSRRRGTRRQATTGRDHCGLGDVVPDIDAGLARRAYFRAQGERHSLRVGRGSVGSPEATTVPLAQPGLWRAHCRLDAAGREAEHTGAAHPRPGSVQAARDRRLRVLRGRRKAAVATLVPNPLATSRKRFRGRQPPHQ